MYSKCLPVLLLLLYSTGLCNSYPCITCQPSPLSTDPTCRCDEICSVYDDCCFDVTNISSSVEEQIYTEYMHCNSRYLFLKPRDQGDAYYMIDRCPFNWTADEEYEASVGNNCTTLATLPPVSDSTTGITYRNEYCAICHNINTTSLLIWQTRLRCQRIFQNVTEMEPITIETILEYCSICAFDPPNNTLVLDILRWCIPVVSDCPQYNSTIHINFNSTEYLQLNNSCINGPYEPIYERSFFLNEPYTEVYQNLQCAECNGLTELQLVCVYPFRKADSEVQCEDTSRETNVMPGLQPGPLPFSAILDVQGSGKVTISSTEISKTEVITCSRNEIFDPGTGCRMIICPVGSQLNDGVCVTPTEEPTSTSTVKPTVPTDFNISNGNETDFTAGTINCTSIALDESEYQLINESTVLFQGEVYPVIGYDANDRPLICVDFNRTGEIEINTTVTFLQYPEGFTELTYIGCSLSIIGSLMILFTYTIFKEIRTLPSKLLMNLAVAFLVSDLFFLLGGSIIRSVEFCTATAIIKHFFFLSRFSWMNILGVEYTRIFTMAIQMKRDEKRSSKKKLLIMYVILGWGIPLLITILTIIVNYTIDDAVRYGTDIDGSLGLCWINDTLSAIIAFVVPIFLSILLNSFLFVTVVILICVASSDSKYVKSQRSTQIRIIAAIFTVLGITWIFGFIALLANQSWPWYPFIILNSTQALMVSIMFLGTKKIILRYYSFCCGFKKGKISIQSTKSTQDKQTREYLQFESNTQAMDSMVVPNIAIDGRSTTSTHGHIDEDTCQTSFNISSGGSNDLFKDKC